MSKQNIQAESAFPSFDPMRYEIKNNRYYRKIGLGTAKFYLPEIDRTVWISCDNRFIRIQADVVRDKDGNDGYDETDGYLSLCFTVANEMSDDIVQWLPMIKETLIYTIRHNALHFPEQIYSLPVALLPDSIRINADSDYLAWLQERGENADIEGGRDVIVYDNYLYEEIEELKDIAAVRKCGDECDSMILAWARKWYVVDTPFGIDQFMNDIALLVENGIIDMEFGEWMRSKKEQLGFSSNKIADTLNVKTRQS